jgi:type VI secretion system protein ImpF
MAFQLDRLVSISVLDRLIDLEPTPESIDGKPRQFNTDKPMTHAESVRRLRASVRRDLEWLLNSRRIAVPPSPDLAQVNASVYIYGLPDLSNVSLANYGDQAKLLVAIQKTIALFEPRLSDVKVVPVPDEGKKHIQRLDFRIEALLMMDPAPELVSFDTTLDGVSQSYKIKTEAGA